jgi:hypothetical protein
LGRKGEVPDGPKSDVLSGSLYPSNPNALPKTSEHPFLRHRSLSRFARLPADIHRTITSEKLKYFSFYFVYELDLQLKDAYVKTRPQEISM